MIDALAEQSGEPSAATIQAAVKRGSTADEAANDLGSVEQYIYTNRLSIQAFSKHAVGQSNEVTEY